MGIFAYGYGLYTDNLKYRLDWEQQLIEHLPPILKKEFEDEYELNKADMSREEFMSDFISDWDGGFSSHGTEGLIAAAINEEEFGEHSIFYGEEASIFAVPGFPREEKDRELIPTVDTLRDALSKWISLIGTNPEDIEIGYKYFKEL